MTNQALSLYDDCPGIPESSLADYLQVIWRQRRWILALTLLAVIVGGAITWKMKPVYRSTARILVDSRSSSVRALATDDPLNNPYTPVQNLDVLSQIEVLQGAAVMRQVYETAGLTYTPNDPGPQPASITVKQVGETDVIEIFADSHDPRIAERLARALPDLYAGYVVGNRSADVTRSLAFARERLKDEDKKLSEAERDLEAFKNRTGVTQLDKQRESSIGQVAEAASAAARSSLEASAASAKLASLIRARDALAPTIETPITTTNPNIVTVENQLATLKNQRVSLEVLYKPTDPKLQTLDAEIADLQSRLDSMPRTVTTVTHAPNPALDTYADKIAEVSAGLRAANAQLTRARAQQQLSSPKLTRFNGYERIQAQLQRSVDNYRETVAFLGKSVDELSLREQALRTPLQVISPAGAASRVAPRPVAYLTAAGLIGLMLGIMVAFLRNSRDDTIHKSEEIRRLVSSPALGYIPRMHVEEARLTGANSDSSTMDVFRFIRANVQLAASEKPIRSLLVTSASPGEGKSLTAASVAAAYAGGGRSVVLVDADLRRSSVHRRFGLPCSPGLTDVLTGGVPLAEVIHETGVENLRVVTAGSGMHLPAELLASAQMGDTHRALLAEAEVVIYDSPPFVAAPDSQVLAHYADGLLLVASPGSVQRGALQYTLEVIGLTGVRLLGLVLNRVTPTSGGYGYGYGYDARALVAVAGRASAGQRKPLDRSVPFVRTLSDDSTFPHGTNDFGSAETIARFSFTEKEGEGR